MEDEAGEHIPEVGHGQDEAGILLQDLHVVEEAGAQILELGQEKA